MSRELIASKVPLPIGRELHARAKSRHVTVSAYVAEVLRQHVSGGALTFTPCRMGPEPTSKKTKIRSAGNKTDAKLDELVERVRRA